MKTGWDGWWIGSGIVVAAVIVVSAWAEILVK